MNNTIVTGDLCFRRMETLTKDGRKICLVFGLLAIPDDFVLSNDCKYVVESRDGGLTFYVNPASRDDTQQKTAKHPATYGWLPDDMLAEQMWRYRQEESP